MRPAVRLFYAQEKAELEGLLQGEAAARSAGIALFLLRPSIVLGPHAVGAKDLLPGTLARRLTRWAGRLPLPVLVPALPLQLVHEEDMGRALLQCVVAAGPPGAYNIAADGIVTAADIARELGMLPLSLPAGPAQSAALAIAAVPFLPAVAQWVEAVRSARTGCPVADVYARASLPTAIQSRCRTHRYRASPAKRPASPSPRGAAISDSNACSSRSACPSGHGLTPRLRAKARAAIGDLHAGHPLRDPWDRQSPGP